MVGLTELAMGAGKPLWEYIAECRVIHLEFERICARSASAGSIFLLCSGAKSGDCVLGPNVITEEISQMLTEQGCRQRRSRLWQQIPEEIEWLLVGDVRHVQYLSGFRVNPISFSADQKGLLLLQRSGKTVLLADNFAKRSAGCPYFVDDEIIIPWYTHRRSVTSRHEALTQAIAEARPCWSGNTGLIEPEGLTEMTAAMVAEDAAWQFAADDDAEPQTLGDVLRELRRSKDEDEIALLRRCMQACAAGHRRAIDVIQPGISELEVYFEVQRAAQAEAGEPCIVYGDFRATHARLPKAGGLPTDYRLCEGDLFILDYSVILHGYRSDFTNTLPAGTPSNAAADQLLACRETLRTTAQLLRPGASCRELWQVASATLEQHGMGALTHHAGHGLGLEHPEPPILVSESTDVLRCGDVVTLEPGCYREGVGGVRLENNYLITESGSEQLNATPWE
jgi:Xaa-Pro aminopeptidase